MNRSQDVLKFYFIHVIVAVITLACFLMNGPMRGGLPLDTTLAERIVFIADNQFLWSVSWCVWMASALGLFVFCTILADELKPSFLRVLGLAIVAMGIAPDLIAEVIYAFVMPKLITQGLDQSLIQMLEVLATHLTGYLGNGLYNIGGMILTLVAIRQRVVVSWVAAWGVLSWTLGILLSIAVALGSMKGAEFFTATSMVLSTLWMLVFAYKVLRR